jgi:hypothetical protein
MIASAFGCDIRRAAGLFDQLIPNPSPEAPFLFDGLHQSSRNHLHHRRDTCRGQRK